MQLKNLAMQLIIFRIIHPKRNSEILAQFKKLRKNSVIIILIIITVFFSFLSRYRNRLDRY